MKNILLKSGKKLSKKELRTIAGGKLNCMTQETLCTNPPCEQIPFGTCTKISKNCAQEECRPDYNGKLSSLV